jgi:predicted phosphodiesterase
MARYAQFAAISCTHCPYQSERAIEKLLHELKGRKLTHFIHCGDAVDAEAASVHNGNEPVGHTLIEEYKVAADMLRRIREALPKDCKLVLLDGNHDDNVQQPDSRRIKYDLRELCNPRKMHGVADEYNRWQHVPYRFGSCYQLGAVIFSHGFSASATSDDLEAVQLAMACGGHPWRLVVRGHTHRPVPPTQCRRSARVRLPWHYCNVGYMAFDERPSYTNRFDIQQWGRAVLIGECKIGRADRLGKDSWKARLHYLD